MTQSPGHRKWPDHRVAEERIGQRVQVFFNGESVADSRDVLRLVEDKHPQRFYFPGEDVSMEALERTRTTTTCPFKGIAHYYSLVVGERRAEDAVWTYEDPYEEHTGLKGRMAFYDEEVDEIRIGDD